MPIYEYECKSCGNKFEHRCDITAKDEEIKCPQCGTKNPRRTLSKFGVGSSGSGSGSGRADSGFSGGSCSPRRST